MPIVRHNSFKSDRPVGEVGRREAFKSPSSYCKSTDLLDLDELGLLTLSFFGGYNTREFLGAAVEFVEM